MVGWSPLIIPIPDFMSKRLVIEIELTTDVLIGETQSREIATILETVHGVLEMEGDEFRSLLLFDSNETVVGSANIFQDAR
jgi:hypothetical protein